MTKPSWDAPQQRQVHVTLTLPLLGPDGWRKTQASWLPAQLSPNRPHCPPAPLELGKVSSPTPREKGRRLC